MFHNLYICSCITCCLIVYNYLYYHALCGAFSEIKSFKSFKRYLLIHPYSTSGINKHWVMANPLVMGTELEVNLKNYSGIFSWNVDIAVDIF